MWKPSLAPQLRSEASDRIVPLTIQILQDLFHRFYGVGSSCVPDGHSLFTSRTMVKLEVDVV